MYSPVARPRAIAAVCFNLSLMFARAVRNPWSEELLSLYLPIHRNLRGKG